MNMVLAYKQAFNNYANFKGRSNRPEYWWFVLANLIIGLILGLVLGSSSSITLLSDLFELAILVPSVSLLVRRLHDTGRSGWWFFIGLIPILGQLVLLYFLVQPGVPGANQYGEVPQPLAR
ncbi:MAG: DUF805 domain-containing protein [Acidimicrobiales bacterium]